MKRNNENLVSELPEHSGLDGGYNGLPEDRKRGSCWKVRLVNGLGKARANIRQSILTIKMFFY
jgi:hypothetical protein